MISLNRRDNLWWDSTHGEVPVADDKPSVPDVYCDQINMVQSAYGITFTFGVGPSSPTLGGSNRIEERVVLRMSLELAKVLAMLVHKNVKQYELEHLGDPIRIPIKQLEQMGLLDEPW